MVEFCPECGNMLRKNSCRCGYNKKSISFKKGNNNTLIGIWNPPSPKAIYCKITATSYNKLKSKLNKGLYPEKLKEITKKVKLHLYSCLNCVYYNEEILHCQFKNKRIKRDSICRSFEPFE